MACVECDARPTEPGVLCTGGHVTCVTCLPRLAAAAYATRPAVLSCGACGQPFPPAALAAACVPRVAAAATEPPRLEAVPPGSPEWAFCETLVLGPSPDSRAERFRSMAVPLAVQRIVNPALMQRYRTASKLVAEECRDAGGAFDANEVWVLHGSGDTSPEAIWRADSGADGIDPRYCGDGRFFGKAAYFAESAAYSHSYAHIPSPAVAAPAIAAGAGGAAAIGRVLKQIFVARLAAGRAEPRTRGVAVNGVSCEATLHPSKGYHSIRADVGGPLMAYMSYTVNRSYPVYLITYAEVNPGDAPAVRAGRPLPAAAAAALTRTSAHAAVPPTAPSARLVAPPSQGGSIRLPPVQDGRRMGGEAVTLFPGGPPGATAAALAKVPVGGTLILSPGTHTEQLWLTAAQGVVTILGAGAVVATAGKSAFRCDAPAATIEGVTLRATGPFCHGVEVGAGRVSVLKCVIHSASSAGVVVRPNASPRIEGCVIDGCGSHGIAISGGGLFRDNDIRDNGGAGVCVVAGGAPTVEGNRVAGNAGNGISGGGGRVRGNTVRGNKMDRA